jgi:dynactin complex subunit
LLEEIKGDEITIEHKPISPTKQNPVINVIKEHPLKNRKRSPGTRAKISASHRKRNIQAKHDAEMRSQLDSIIQENVSLKSQYDMLKSEHDAVKTQFTTLLETMKQTKQKPSRPSASEGFRW